MPENELAILYHLLAQCFIYPNVYSIEALKKLMGELKIETWGSRSDRQPILPIAPFVRTLAALNRRTIRDLQQEYARLFGEDGSAASCSAYFGSSSLRMWDDVLAQSTQNIFDMWRQGIDIEQTTHIETQLEFLSYLCQHADNEATQLAKQDFLHQCVFNWLPRFAGDVVAATRFDFYRTTAQLLVALLDVEKDYEKEEGGLS